MKQLVISAIGTDRPGLVDRLTEALAGYHANIADSRMVNLRGRFAIIMLAEVTDDRVDELRQRLPAVAESIGLTAFVADADSGDATIPGVPYRIRTYAMDQVGLVHQITHALSELNVNIEDLTTRLEHGPHTGTPLFSMEMVVTVPTDVPLKQMRQNLETLCAELNCDLDIDRA